MAGAALNTTNGNPWGAWGNATLSFLVSGLTTVDDPGTGNPVPRQDKLIYQASLQLRSPNHTSQPGADMTAYSVTGRLLSPPSFDSRIGNGAQADAVVNGHQGRLELELDLTTPVAMNQYLRQRVQGTFRLLGGS
jgi:hypothetical protein